MGRGGGWYARAALSTIPAFRASRPPRIEIIIDAAPASAEQAALISVRGLSHRYAGMARDALHEVDFQVPHGAVTGLLGPNGAGKSTLLAILNGVSAVQRGEVRIAGWDPRDRGWLKAACSLVPQECAFYPTLTGRENLAFFAGVHRLARRRWQRQLDYCVSVCRLDEVLDRRADGYSGGLKRRLNLAIGLINAPEILYLDEPTVGVDAESRQYITEAIATLHRNGTTIVYTSHYMEEVERLCDRITVIDRGRTVASGSLQDLLGPDGGRSLQVTLRDPASADVRAALAPWSAQWVDGRTAVLGSADPSTVTAALGALAAQAAEPTSVHYGARRLEDFYLELVGERGAAA